jgi:superfamily II DNA or RNA helicase
LNTCLVDNKAGILSDEISVLEVFKQRIEMAMQKQEAISFHIAVGFFFFEGFQKLHPLLQQLDSKGLLKSFRLVMGPDTKKSTKEALEALKKDAGGLSGEAFEFLKKLYDEKKFEFRIFLARGFHIKLYLYDFEKSGLEVWAGSANLTGAGLEGNIELVVPTAMTLPERDLFKRFFEEIWKLSTDKVENLKVIDIVRRTYVSKYVYLHPRAFIVNLIRIMGKEYLVKNIGADLSYLAEFQNMSYYLCVEKLKNYGGCVFANSPGVGKTDVGCTIARYYKELGKKILIIYPPVIEHHWKTTLQKVGLKESEVEWLSRGMLQKSDFNYERYSGLDLIIVDEAHHFRISKPKSNRRENLENIIKLNPTSHVLLITATPINTSLLDFTELLKLFLKGNYKERLETEGVLVKMREIEHIVKEEEVISRELIDRLNELIKKFTIRIEWPDIREYFKEDLRKIAGVNDFESPEVSKLNYAYDEEIARRVFDRVVPFLEKLNFEYTKLWEREYKEDKNLRWWYQWRLYKRLESSIIAFKISVENILEKNVFLGRFLAKVLIDEKHTEHVSPFSRERLENMKSTFLSLPKPRRKKVLARIRLDVTSIREMLAAIEGIKNLEGRDEKVRELIRLLTTEKKPTLVFSESRDTVLYISRRLKRNGRFRFDVAFGGEEPIDEETGEPREKVLDKEILEKRFNDGEFDVLVTTDIMGEGVNLPRADVVVNFDLPYNPARLIQRDGRAIRITNPKKIKIYNFEPDKRIDKELDLCSRLAKRVENIVSTIGLDFLIWSIEQKKIEHISEDNRKRVIALIREYKDLLATKTPEELHKGLPPTLSKEDRALRDFIKYWNISDETVNDLAREYQKPILTGFEKREMAKYFIVFNYRGSIHSIGDMSFSEKKLETTLGNDDFAKIDSFISERCLELDKEFLKTSYSKDRLTLQVEKTAIEKGLQSVLKEMDVSVLTKKDKLEILKLLARIDKIPPWKRDEEIEQIIKNLRETMKARGYQKSLEQPKLIGVIKYE